MVRVLVVEGVVLIGLSVLFFALRPESGSSSDGDRAVEAEISGGKMDPGEISVSEGDRVTLLVGSDAPVELHLHGYDIETEVALGSPAEVRFDADLSGRFEIEDHETEEVLGVPLVRLR